jgi:hypothetical protein
VADNDDSESWIVSFELFLDTDLPQLNCLRPDEIGSAFHRASISLSEQDLLDFFWKSISG